MTDRAHHIPIAFAAMTWHARLRSVVATGWARLCAPALSERDRFLGRATSHAELERRMRQWDDTERGPWWPPR